MKSGLVSELFGPTIQGEGPHAGQRVGFLRLANCNLACSWCDTPYSWDWKRFDKATEAKEVSADEIIAGVITMDVNRLVVTGGEPLMQQELICDVQLWTSVYLDIETNGTIYPSSDLVEVTDLFAVSPKLSNSGDRLSKRIKPDVLGYLQNTGKAIFKFVAATPSDLDEVQQIVDDVELNNVWIMPFGASRDTHLQSLITLTDEIVARGWNVSPRLHILAWDSKRGV